MVDRLAVKLVGVMVVLWVAQWVVYWAVQKVGKLVVPMGNTKAALMVGLKE